MDPAVVAELQREVEDLKLRLHMAAEHYKEKYKECQRLQKQVLRLSEQQGVGSARNYCIMLCQLKWKNRAFVIFERLLFILTKYKIKISWYHRHLSL